MKRRQKDHKLMSRFDVCIAGELNLDLILYGLPREIPVERELLATGMRVTLGGSSGIVAHNMAAMGARVGFVSLIGSDPFGDIALERMAKGGVDVSRVRRMQGASTGLSTILQRGSQRSILTYPGTMFQMSYDDLDLEYLASAQHFHLAALFLQENLRPRVAELFREMKTAGLTTSLDTNDDPRDLWDGVDEILRYVDVFLPNEREARKIGGTEDLPLAIKRLSEMVPIVAVKIGSKGAMARRGSEEHTVPAMPVEVVDAVGAGDSFDAGFLFQYLQGADLPTCLEFGNLAGALSTTQPGGTEAFRDRAAMEEFLREKLGLANGVRK